MLKLVGLGAVLALGMCCCCSMGTFLPESLGQGGPTSWQDLLDTTQADDAGARSSAEPSSSGDEGGAGGIPLLGDKLPNISSPLGQTEIEIGQMGEIGDVPVYPKAEPVSEKVNLPGALSALMGQWRTGLQDEGVAYALYSTSDTPAKAVAWYKTEMSKQGWKTEMALDGIGDGSVLSFSKSGQDGGALIYTFDDPESGRTLIFVLRGTED